MKELETCKEEVVALTSKLTQKDDELCSLKRELAEARADQEKCAHLKQQLDAVKVCQFELVTDRSKLIFSRKLEPITRNVLN